MKVVVSSVAGTTTENERCGCWQNPTHRLTRDDLVLFQLIAALVAIARDSAVNRISVEIVMSGGNSGTSSSVSISKRPLLV